MKNLLSSNFCLVSFGRLVREHKTEVSVQIFKTKVHNESCCGEDGKGTKQLRGCV